MDTSGDKPDAFDDGILTKSNHGVILMMEKTKKHRTGKGDVKTEEIKNESIKKSLRKPHSEQLY